eukprot:957872-Prorocentrum_minimum.AAC.8
MRLKSSLALLGGGSRGRRRRDRRDGGDTPGPIGAHQTPPRCNLPINSRKTCLIFRVAPAWPPRGAERLP